jgi:hypothetical protein
MYRGTTPTISFNLPFEVSNIKRIWVTFSQSNSEVLTVEPTSLEGKTVNVRLTQRETLLFKPNSLVKVQLRILNTRGDALASQVINFHVNEILKNGEIV